MTSGWSGTARSDGSTADRSRSGAAWCRSTANRSRGGAARSRSTAARGSHFTAAATSLANLHALGLAARRTDITTTADRSRGGAGRHRSGTATVAGRTAEQTSFARRSRSEHEGQCGHRQNSTQHFDTLLIVSETSRVWGRPHTNPLEISPSQLPVSLGPLR